MAAVPELGAGSGKHAGTGGLEARAPRIAACCAIAQCAKPMFEWRLTSDSLRDITCDNFTPPRQMLWRTATRHRFSRAATPRAEQQGAARSMH